MGEYAVVVIPLALITQQRGRCDFRHLNRRSYLDTADESAVLCTEQHAGSAVASGSEPAYGYSKGVFSLNERRREKAGCPICEVLSVSTAIEL